MQTEDAKVSTNISNELIDQLPLVVGGAMRSVFDLVSTDSRGEGQRHERRPRRRAGWRVRRDARRHLGQHQSQRRRRRDRVPDAVGRSHHGVLGRDQRLQARIRAGRRRRDHVRVQVGHQPVPGLGLQLSPQRRPRRERLLRGDEGDLPAEQLRRVLGRAGQDPAPVRRPEQDVLLRRLRRLQEQPGVECADPERADARDVQRRFFQLGGQPGPDDRDLRSGDHAPQSQRHRFHHGIPSRATGFPPTASAPSRRQYLALARSAVVPNRAGLVPGTLGYVVEQLSLAGRDDEGDDAQVQPEDRSRAQRRASPRRISSTGRPTTRCPGASGAAGLPAPFNTFQSIELRWRSAPRQLGLDCRPAHGESPERRR